MPDIDVDLDKLEDFRDAMIERLKSLETFQESVGEGGKLYTHLELGGGGSQGQGADSYSTDSPTATFQTGTRAAGYWSGEELNKLNTMASNLVNATKAMRDAANTILENNGRTEDANAQDSDTRSDAIA